ncbi:MAG: phosphonate metabolism protein/1,5-bisphosphokinase (PRPP-forming) PhnN [Candidatus Hodarchaeota archaeon]
MIKKFHGILFLIVGNSGSGKDTIITEVAKNYPSNMITIFVPKRYITRPPSEFEKNISITTQEFREMDKRGMFALKWHIYELDYGIPIEIDNYLKNGHPVIINVSRTIVKEAREKYDNIKVIFIEVPFEITYKRIKDRKRESEELLKERIERARTHQQFPEADFTIDNSGNLDDAVNQCLNYLLKVIKRKEKEKN